jgi:site-specific DNA recombinase
VANVEQRRRCTGLERRPIASDRHGHELVADQKKELLAVFCACPRDRLKENHTIASQTAALIEFAQKNGYTVPPEWVFQDEGYSGAILVRPGLEALRDLAAEGQIAAALVYSPDRLSRKYGYQVLLSEELSRCGVELIFLKAPAGATPEDQLLVQFQGMIAEYERAQIAERCRRGKKHMAQQGGVNVLSGAPYGYRYLRKSEPPARRTILGADRRRAEGVRTAAPLGAGLHPNSWRGTEAGKKGVVK